MTGQDLASFVSIDASEWRAAPIDARGETVFAIGDVHGCSAQLGALLEYLSALARDQTGTRLIFLGDLIARGPNSLEALRLWASPKLDAQFGRVHRITGNHDQLLVLAISDDAVAQAAHDRWMGMDGKTVLDELRRATGRPEAELTRALLCEAVGDTVLDRLDHLETHLRIGNLLFVHAGLDPSVPPEIALSAPFTQFGGNHWAWIQAPFLTWRGGFGGPIVVHGHTPPAKHREMTGLPDPIVLQYDRLCLDGGSAKTGIVAAAQIENGRYRVFKARTA